MQELERLQTEGRNPATVHIDRASTMEMLTLINAEDQRAPLAVREEIPRIALAVDVIVEKMASGGRLIYCGAGTSGRLGLLDAAEIPPTYGMDPSRVVGLLAGGTGAMFKAVEGAEDDAQLGADDLKAIGFSKGDALCALAASGRTPYCIGAMEYAKAQGAPVISICCNPGAPMTQLADIAITPATGPEAITGSTRMKAGTAQKITLNMLSTAVMIKLGKVYENLMVDMRPTNIKLQDRAARIVVEATGAPRAQAEAALKETGYDVKLAVFMLISGLDKTAARTRLDAAGGYIANA